jgi:periplasmic protein TonB
MPMSRWPSLLLLVLVAPLQACTGDQELERPSPLFGDVPIEYPLELWDRGVEGETLLRVRVSEMGVVDSVEVLESSGHAGLDSAAVSGASKLRFQPGRRAGKRIPVWATVPVHFSKQREPDMSGGYDR